MGEYTDYPADYAEVSQYQSGQQSPAPYATTTLIGSSKLGNSNDANRFNMFYTTEIYPPSSSGAMAVPNQNNNNNYNRSIHSESYCNQNSNSNKMNIVENRMANTMMPSMFNQHQQQRRSGSNKRNRLKLMNPQNFRINFGGSQSEQLYVKVGDISSQASSTAQQTPQSQNGSINWSQHNIYENQDHHANSAATLNDPDKEYIYAGNRSIMSYMSSKDFPENV